MYDHERVQYLCYEHEVCPETQREHWQGYIEMRTKQRLTAMKKLFGRGIHWEPSYGDWKSNRKYCSKDSNNGTFQEFGAPVVAGFSKASVRVTNKLWDAVKLPDLDDEEKEAYVARMSTYQAIMKDNLQRQEKRLVAESHYRNIPDAWYPWQAEVNELLLENQKAGEKIRAPDERKIIWVYDAVGNHGKTWFAKSYSLMHNALILPGNVETKRMVYGMKDFDIVFFDCTRSGRVNYDAIEMCKNGTGYNEMYIPGEKWWRSPHVVVLANFMYDETALSADRWHLIRV